MKNLLLTLFLLTGLLAYPAHSASAAAALSLSPATKTIKVGDSFSVQILFDTGADTLSKIKASFNFPPSLLEVETNGIDITGSVAGKNLPERLYSSTKGTVDVTGLIPATITGPGQLLATVKFKSRAVGTANLNFDNESQAISNATSQNVLSLTDSKGAAYSLVTELPALPVTTKPKTATPSALPNQVGFDRPTQVVFLFAGLSFILGIILARRPAPKF